MSFLEPEITLEPKRADDAPVDEARAQLIARTYVAKHAQGLRKSFWAILGGILVAMFFAGGIWFGYQDLQSKVAALEKLHNKKAEAKDNLEELVKILKAQLAAKGDTP